MQNQNKKRIWIAVCCFAVFAVTCWFLIKSIFFPSVGFGIKRLPSIAFFTIQSNILATLWLFYIGLCEITDRLPKPRPVIGMMLSCYIIVTGIVYWAVLVPMLGFAKELFAISNIWMHTITPVAVPVVFSLLAKEGKIKYSGILVMLGYPLIYSVYAYILHAAIGVYVYPFFNPSVMGGRFAVAIAVAVIGAVFAGFGLLFRHIWNRAGEADNIISKQQEL